MHCESCLQVTNRDKLYVDDCYVCRAIVQVDRDQKGIVLIRQYNYLGTSGYVLALERGLK